MAVRNLVALEINVGLDPETGYADYPNFNLISSATRQGMDWAKYIDAHGNGMHYDKTCGHKEDSAESPYGHQFCCLCVPKAFADEALALFPDKVRELTEVEFEDFHDNKAHAHESDENIATDVLNGLNARRTLMKALAQDTAQLDVKIAKALDPLDKTEQGVLKNDNRLWADSKAVKGIELKSPKI
jgi:hypothetical protein